MGQKVKLRTHQASDSKLTYRENDFIFCPKDFPTLTIGDVIEIYSVDNNDTRLLLPITAICDEYRQDKSVSVKQEIAERFDLAQARFKDVIVNKMENLREVTLDLVELWFTSQYVSRSDMWRLKRFLLQPKNHCVYLLKNITFCGINCRVYDLWSRGERMSCGIVDNDTRVVFRSSSAKFYIFIQMSAEMWQFDMQGDLFFEKCVHGFLPELFEYWKAKNCSHYVSIVIFSRWFFKSTTTEAQFPPEAHGIVQLDYKGRFYIDFYKLIVQNEHYDDWFHVLGKLRPLLNEYSQSILNEIAAIDPSMPNAENCYSEDGSFLETINVVMNVFCSHNVDRNFERTGQTNVVVTPGPGVFSVCRNLSNLTKQRVIDYGISLDVVCLGEQPLHAVPLFIFHNKQKPHSEALEDKDYHVPHWMNISYYGAKSIGYGNASFVPRIHLPESLRDAPVMPMLLKNSCSIRDGMTNSNFVDYDKHDRELFAPPIDHMTGLSSPKKGNRRLSGRNRFSTICSSSISPEPRRRKISDFLPERPVSRTDTFGVNISVSRDDINLVDRNIVGSAESPSIFDTNNLFCNDLHVKGGGHSISSPPPMPASLFNPFKPADYSVRITSNRRRWIHVFPTDRKGLASQSHHFLSGTPIIFARSDSIESLPGIEQQPTLTAAPSSDNLTGIVVVPCIGNSYAASGSGGTQVGRTDTIKPKSIVWAWGVTGEEQWNPELLIDVDWKGLTVPACLPTTTDFFPDAHSMRNDYFFAEHTVLLDQNFVCQDWGINCEDDVFDELICQRLQQGFQIILLPIDMLHSATMALLGSTVTTRKAGTRREIYMSINRIYHWLVLHGNSIIITKFFPRHCYNLIPYNYYYLFQVPDASSYAPSKTVFDHTSLELYKWSLLDIYIVGKGDQDDFTFHDDMKFWNARFMLLPGGHNAIKLIQNGAKNCDLFENFFSGEFMSPILLIDSFIRFLELLNRIRRPAQVWRIGECRASKKQQYDLRFDTSVELHQGADAYTAKSPTEFSNERQHDDIAVKGSRQGSPITPISPIPSLSILTPAAVLAYLMETASTKLRNHDIIGIGFITDPRVPQFTFISAELVHWLIDYVSDISSFENAMQFCQALLAEGRIGNISGSSRNAQFCYGFVLYYIVPQPEVKLGAKLLSNLNLLPTQQTSTQQQTTSTISKLLEVVCILPPQMSENFSICDGNNTSEQCIFARKQAKQDIITGDQPPVQRQEWWILHYSGTFCCLNAFEFEMQWCVATGCVVGDMLSGLCVKANQTMHHHLVPVPTDPFALPFNSPSYPLRCPIIVKMHSCIVSQITDDHDLLRFQSFVLRRFGFISMSCEQHSSNREFIHLCGGMFVRLDIANASAKGSFMWCWNFMLGRRYRSRSTFDEEFLDKTLADFRAFCRDDYCRISNCFAKWKTDFGNLNSL